MPSFQDTGLLITSISDNVESVKRGLKIHQPNHVCITDGQGNVTTSEITENELNMLNKIDEDIQAKITAFDSSIINTCNQIINQLNSRMHDVGLRIESSLADVQLQSATVTLDDLQNTIGRNVITNGFHYGDLTVNANVLEVENLNIIGNTVVSTLNTTRAMKSSNFEIISESLRDSAVKIIQKDSQSQNPHFIDVSVNGDSKFVVKNDGMTGINNANPTKHLDIVGDVNFTGKINNATAVEFSHLSGLTGNIQTQINDAYGNIATYTEDIDDRLLELKAPISAQITSVENTAFASVNALEADLMNLARDTSNYLMLTKQDAIVFDDNFVYDAVAKTVSLNNKNIWKIDETVPKNLQKGNIIVYEDGLSNILFQPITNIDREYPPDEILSENVASSGFTATISNKGYGNGNYKIFWSSSTNNGIRLFDNTHPYFFEENTYDATTGSYKGDKKLVEGYGGEWVVLEFPFLFMISSVKIKGYGFYDYELPKDFKVYGSDDNATWNELAHFTDHVLPSQVPYDFVGNITTDEKSIPYKFIGLCFNKSFGGVKIGMKQIVFTGKEYEKTFNQFALLSDLATKNDLVTGGASSILSNNFTDIGKVLVSNDAGKVAASTVDISAFDNILGVDSNIQVQIDTKDSVVTISSNQVYQKLSQIQIDSDVLVGNISIPSLDGFQDKITGVSGANFNLDSNNNMSFTGIIEIPGVTQILPNVWNSSVGSDYISYSNVNVYNDKITIKKEIQKQHPYIVSSGSAKTDYTNVAGTNDYIYTFTSNNNNSITFPSDGTIDVLIVGGGGSGGSNLGGGGGGGTVYVAYKMPVKGGMEYPIVVGDGGRSLYDEDGGDSSAFGAVALGGGAGGNSFRINGNSKGTGGGGGISTDGSSRYLNDSNIKLPRENMTNSWLKYTSIPHTIIVSCKSSPILNANVPVWKIFDGSTSTYWETRASVYATNIAIKTYRTGYAGEWLMVDLGEQILLKTFEIYKLDANKMPKSFRVFGTNTDSSYIANNVMDNWELIYEITDDTRTPSTVAFFGYTVAQPRMFRYYMFIFNKVFNSTALNMSELKFYGNAFVINSYSLLNGSGGKNTANNQYVISADNETYSVGEIMKFPREYINISGDSSSSKYQTITYTDGTVVKIMSSGADSTLTACKMFDLNTDGRGWCPLSRYSATGLAINTHIYDYKGEWFSVDLGEKIFLNSISIERCGFLDRYPLSFRLYATNDSGVYIVGNSVDVNHKSWKMIHEDIDNNIAKNYPSMSRYNYDLNISKPYRHYLFVCNKAQPSIYLEIDKFNIYGRKVNDISYNSISSGANSAEIEAQQYAGGGGGAGCRADTTLAILDNIPLLRGGIGVNINNILPDPLLFGEGGDGGSFVYSGYGGGNKKCKYPRQYEIYNGSRYMNSWIYKDGISIYAYDTNANSIGVSIDSYTNQNAGWYSGVAMSILTSAGVNGPYDGPFFMIDFGEAYVLNAVNIYPRPDQSAREPKNFRIYASTSRDAFMQGVNDPKWVFLQEFSSYKTAAESFNNSYYVLTDNNTPYRYYFVIVNSVISSTAVQLAEIEFYSKEFTSIHGRVNTGGGGGGGALGVNGGDGGSGLVVVRWNMQPEMKERRLINSDDLSTKQNLLTFSSDFTHDTTNNVVSVATPQLWEDKYSHISYENVRIYDDKIQISDSLQTNTINTNSIVPYATCNLLQIGDSIQITNDIIVPGNLKEIYFGGSTAINIFTNTDGISYKYSTFTTNGSITFEQNTSCDILIVGGGGSGAVNLGGGSSGGLLYATNQTIPSGSYPITVGAGGVNGNGGDSIAFGATAYGGLQATTTTGATKFSDNLPGTTIDVWAENKVALLGGSTYTNPSTFFNDTTDMTIWFKFSGTNGKYETITATETRAKTYGNPIVSNNIMYITGEDWMKIAFAFDYLNDITISIWYRFDNDVADARILDFQDGFDLSNFVGMRIIRGDAQNKSSLVFIINSTSVVIDFGHEISGPMIHLTWIIKESTGYWMIYKNGSLLFDGQKIYIDVERFIYPYLGHSAEVGGLNNQVSLRDFRIYRKALTAEEINSLSGSATPSGGGGVGSVGESSTSSTSTPSGGNGFVVPIRTAGELFAGGGGANGGTRVPVSGNTIGYGGNSASSVAGAGGDGIVIVRWPLNLPPYQPPYLPTSTHPINTVANTNGTFFKYCKFTNNGSITFAQDTVCDIFMIGGGGGGGNHIGGGGGAGAGIFYKNYTFTNIQHDIVVGNGGNAGLNGTDSIIKKTSDNSVAFQAKGGGGGGDYLTATGNNASKSGGCGAGVPAITKSIVDANQGSEQAMNTVSTNIVNYTQNIGPSKTNTYAVYGNKGAPFVPHPGGSLEILQGSGGGGIGAEGSTNIISSVTKGYGGDGLSDLTLGDGTSYNIKNHFGAGILNSADSKYYIGGGGGGGGFSYSYNIVTGGLGGGGNGHEGGNYMVIPNNAQLITGVANTGSGGGGGGGNGGLSGVGGAGGSGVVIIRWESPGGYQTMQLPHTMRSQGNIWMDGSSVVWTSDERIKKEIQDIDDDSALNKVLALEPKKYHYKDYLSRGNNEIYGFISQQVKEVIPEATTNVENFIPNVYQLCNFINTDAGDSVIQLPNEFDISTLSLQLNSSNISTLVKLINNDNESLTTKYELTNVDGGGYGLKTQNLTVFNGNKSNVFVYGTQVEDMTTIDKSYLFTLNVCATQTLVQKVQVLQSANYDLLAKIDTLENEILSLESSS